MHIVYICREYPPSLRGGGIASYIKEIALGMRKVGHDVTIICASDNTRETSDAIDNKGIRVIRLSGGDFIISEVEGKSIIKKFRPLYRFWSYRKKIREVVLSLKNVDIIEVPEYGAENYYLRGIGIPVVIRLHTPTLFDHNNMGKKAFSLKSAPFYWQSLQELRLIREAKYITSCSTSLKEWAVKNTGNNPNDIKVVFNPINTTIYDTAISGESYTLDPKVKNVLFAGTVCDWKGCGDLADTGKLLSERLNAKGEKLLMKFVGKTGTFANDLKKRYEQDEWFDLVGKVKRDELMQMYAKADVVCFPSWWENMPMVCIEAMLKGAIVIGSCSGGMSEIIEDGKSGYLLEPQEPHLWADKIEEVLNMNAKQRCEMSKFAMERIKSTFDIHVIVKQLDEYFNFVIKDYKE